MIGCCAPLVRIVVSINGEATCGRSKRASLNKCVSGSAEGLPNTRAVIVKIEGIREYASMAKRQILIERHCDGLVRTMVDDHGRLPSYIGRIICDLEGVADILDSNVEDEVDLVLGRDAALVFNLYLHFVGLSVVWVR